MTQERNLTLRNDLTITPAELVENASAQAKLLMNIVEQTRCYQTISGKKYLQVEAWETIGAFNRVHAITRQTLPIIRDGEVVGYQADVELLRDGITVGGASMPCFLTENACKGKEGDAKHKACISAAQTFATSKAYRMNYSYVAILAGFQPTPAEEMTGEAVDDRPANLEHWCEEHKTKFFKRGRMRSYAHTIEGTNPPQWCQEIKPIHSVEQVAKEIESEPINGEVIHGAEEDKGHNRKIWDDFGQPEKHKDSPSPDTTAPGAGPAAQLGFDAEWLLDTLRELNWKEATTKSYLKNILKVSLPATASIVEMVASLSRESQYDFFQMLSKEKPPQG